MKPERDHEWLFTMNWDVSHAYFLCIGGHDGRGGCGARMSVRDAGKALTARQNAARQLAEAQAKLAKYEASDWPHVLGERDQWQRRAMYAAKCVRLLLAYARAAYEYEGTPCFPETMPYYRRLFAWVRKWIEG